MMEIAATRGVAFELRSHPSLPRSSIVAEREGFEPSVTFWATLP